MRSQHIIVIGGSVAGLGTALALVRDGHRVTILEADATPMPATALAAFEEWDRRGSPQTRHSHAFLGRLYGMIRDREPELLDKLLEAGAELIPFREMIRPRFPDAELEPGDEDIVLIATRRTTLEWVLRRYILDSGLVELRDGVEVIGLASAPGRSEGPVRVRGVRLRGPDGSLATLEADLVIDASGRRSQAARWLREIGAPEPREEKSPCGIFYSSRFYRLREGVEPPVLEGGMGGDLGYLKFAIFPGDARIFSITLAASPDDPLLRRVLREQAFGLAAAALPATAAWVDPAVSEPITEVHGMGNLNNTRRFLVEDGEPLALGFFPIGDALIHTNPIVGRGCTLAWVGAYLVAETLRKYPQDPRAFALELHAQVEKEIVPWYEAQIQQDRDAIEVNASQQRGEDPFDLQRPDGSVNPKAYMRSLIRDGLVPAMRQDLFVLRAVMRAFNLLEVPSDLMKRPEILQRVLAVYGERGEREPLVLGPDRRQMLEILQAAG